MLSFEDTDGDTSVGWLEPVVVRGDLLTASKRGAVAFEVHEKILETAATNEAVRPGEE